MRAPSRRMRTDAEMIKTGALEPLVIVMRYTDENAKVRSALEIEHESRIFDRFPGRLEQKSMLRIYVRSFPRRDAKKLRIKLIDGVNKPASQSDRFTGHARLSIIVPLPAPAIR